MFDNKIYQDLENFRKNNQKSRTFIIAIDGKCGSGKTTLAKELKKRYCCDIIHMDDFFLLPEMKTIDRLNEVSGNFHYERFNNEVIKNIKLNKDPVYKVFSCQQTDYVDIKKAKLNNILIIEGSYSCSHNFNQFYNYIIYMECSYARQLERIEKRNNSYMLKRFVKEWIPMENRYFKISKIKENANLVINTD